MNWETSKTWFVHRGDIEEQGDLFAPPGHIKLMCRYLMDGAGLQVREGVQAGDCISIIPHIATSEYIFVPVRSVEVSTEGAFLVESDRLTDGWPFVKP